MKKRRPLVTQKLLLILGAIPLITLFQNCDTGFNLKTPVSLSPPTAGGGGAIVDEDTLIEGKALYESKCSQCHSDLESSAKRNVTASQINKAIMTVASMAIFSNLKESQILAIAEALKDVPSTNPPTNPGDPLPLKYSCVNPNQRGIANKGIRRLTKAEITNSLTDLFGTSVMSKQAVKDALIAVPADSPGDIVKEFQSSHTNQDIESMIGLTEAIAEAVMGTAADKTRIFGSCASSNLDNNCVTNFINTMGLKIMRRPVTEERRGQLVEMYQSASSGDRGLKALLMAMLMSPEFAFHIEMGRTTCTNILPSPINIPTSDSIVFFDPNGGTRQGGSSALTVGGWMVWPIPASTVSNAYQQVVVTASGTAGGGVFPQFSINVNDSPVAADVVTNGTSKEYTFTVNAPKGQALKVGIYYPNPGDGRVLRITSVGLKATSNDPGGNCQVIAANNGRTLLDDYEIAARIAFSVTGSTPDSTLLQEAGKQSLRTVAGVRTQVERLLSTPAARTRLDQITDAWLMTNTIPDPNQTLAQLAGFNAAGLRDEARREINDYVNYMVLDRGADVKTLMTAKLGFPRTNRLAAIYGSGVASGNTPVTLPQGHGGLLLRASVLLSGQVASSPILRGVYVRKRLLCDNLASPDFAVVAQRNEELGAIDRTVFSGRRVAEKITEPESCATCHTQINPLGFVLEAFDPLGRARNEELVYNGMGQVIARHNLDLSVVDAFIEGTQKQPMSSAQELLEGIANSAKIRSCISERFYGHARMRTVANSTDGCALYEVEQALAQGASVKEAFIRSIANEDIFWRKAIGGQ